MFKAVAKGHEDAILKLAEHGGSVNTPDNSGQTPVGIVAYCGNGGATKVLAVLGVMSIQSISAAIHLCVTLLRWVMWMRFENTG